MDLDPGETIVCYCSHFVVLDMLGIGMMLGMYIVAIVAGPAYSTCS